MMDLRTDSVRPVHDALVAAGRNVVVVIGIDRYTAWSNLGNAVNDARGTADAFRRLGFVEHPGLFDEAATRDALHALVTDDLRALGVNDSLVVFFAGHGATVPQILEGTEVKTGYIVPADAENRGGRIASWIRLDHWLADIARLPPRHILVILDACHSGIALDAVRTRDVALPEAGDVPYPLALRRSRQVIVSALDDQLALDGGPTPGHSLFTGYLLDALSHGLRRDGDATASGTELGLYLQKRLAAYPDARQTPSFSRFDLDDHGELIVPLAQVASGITSVPSVNADVNAGLRDRFATMLAERFSDRAAIGRVVREAAPGIAAADLPAGGAAMIWGYVLAELTNARAFSEITALIAAARDSSRRSRRFDWSVFNALLQPRAVPAVASWSHVEVDIHSDSEQTGRAESTLITQGQTLLEADVTLRWGGARPPAPRIEVTSNQLFGTKVRLLHQITQLANPEPAAAQWRVRIPVPAARIRTRWVTVRCAGTDASARRYVVAHRGSLCAGALWLACAGFAAWWLYPISPGLILLPLVAAGLVLGVLPPVVMHLLWRVTGRRSFRRILFAWELAAPIAMLAATLVIVLPPRLLKLVTNYTEEKVSLGGGAELLPLAKSRPTWAWHIPSLQPSQCRCGDLHCECDTPSTIRGVSQVAFGCFAGDCKNSTKYVEYAGRTIKVTHTKGAAVPPLRFGANAASPRMKLTAGDFWAEARDVPRADDTTLELPMLPPGPTYDLTFWDGKTQHGVLQCDKATALVVRIDDLTPASRDGEPEDPKIAIKIGKVHSVWTGALDQTRACTNPGDRDGPKTLNVEPRSEQGVMCHLSPAQRVVVLDAAALAPGHPLPAVESRLSRACLGREGILEIAGISQEVEAKLPADLPFSHLRVRRPQSVADPAVESRCKPGQTLRAVALEVKDDPRFELGAVRVDRIDDATGVTCDRPQKMSDAKRACELKRTALTCVVPPPPPPPLKEVDCRIDTSNHLQLSGTCNPCRRESITDDWKDQAARKGYSCRRICRCE